MTSKIGQIKPLNLEVKHTVSSHFARVHLLNAQQRLGVSKEHLIALAQLPSSLLYQTDARISPQQLAMLYRAIWNTADDEYFGLAPTPSRFGVFELMSERIISCDNLHDALEQAMRFYHLISDNITFTLDIAPPVARFTITRKQAELDTDNLLIEFLLLVWHRFPSWLVETVIPLKEISFSYAAPKHVEEYRLLYPGPASFNQLHNSLVWPAEVLQLPIRRTPKQLRSYLKKIPLPWFLKQKYTASMTDKVIRHLELSDHQAAITLDDVAKKLHLTPRTLRRKLSAEGSSYKKLKDDIRRDRAIYWLSQDYVSVAEVSVYCGYTEPTTFIRAFRTWTGLSPGDYKKRLFHKK